jgi:hypothetical protein
VRHQLVGLLGGGIQRERMIDVLLSENGMPGIGAVHRTGGGVHQVLHGVVPAAFDHVQEAGDVALHVGACGFWIE